MFYTIVCRPTRPSANFVYQYPTRTQSPSVIMTTGNRSSARNCLLTVNSLLAGDALLASVNAASASRNPLYEEFFSLVGNYLLSVGALFAGNTSLTASSNTNKKKTSKKALTKKKPAKKKP